jgi:hypothetical protein
MMSQYWGGKKYYWSVFDTYLYHSGLFFFKSLIISVSTQKPIKKLLERIVAAFT